MNSMNDISCIRARQEALDRMEKDRDKERSYKKNKSTYHLVVQNVRACLRRIKK